jgi:hypothetical protein
VVADGVTGWRRSGLVFAHALEAWNDLAFERLHPVAISLAAGEIEIKLFESQAIGTPAGRQIQNRER